MIHCINTKREGIKKYFVTTSCIPGDFVDSAARTVAHLASHILWQFFHVGVVGGGPAAADTVLCLQASCGSHNWNRTDSNITERETASDSEVHVDHVGEGEEVAGTFSQPSTSQQPQPPACPGQEATQEEEDHGQSSSPTLPLDTSPQPAVIPHHGRRRRELAATGTNAQSLALNLHTILGEVRLRARGALQIVIDACTQTNNPTLVLAYLGRWQLSRQNLLQMPGLPEETTRSVGEPPPTRRPSPQPHEGPIQHRPQHGLLWLQLDLTSMAT
ncbi:uncharacterized protein [Dendrobates tinctorius]|uniref:uncharacterized protein n=1 Tax=Dendrobates tinctorius TaxID=92724 RepID=UPI003CCA12F4